MSTYNGWTNWETWNVALWCDNEYAIYQDRTARRTPWTAESAKEYVEGWFPNGTPDMQDMAWHEERGAVNWREIAQHWQADAEEDAA